MPGAVLSYADKKVPNTTRYARMHKFRQANRPSLTLGLLGRHLRTGIEEALRSCSRKNRRLKLRSDCPRQSANEKRCAMQQPYVPLPQRITGGKHNVSVPYGQKNRPWRTEDIYIGIASRQKETRYRTMERYRAGERWERRLWREKRPERVAAVDSRRWHFNAEENVGLRNRIWVVTKLNVLCTNWLSGLPDKNTRYRMM